MAQYEGSVRMPRWLTSLIGLAAAATLASAVPVLTEDGAGAGRVPLTLLLVAVALLLAVVVMAFGALRIAVDNEVLRFHVGSFGRTRPAPEIESVEAEPYRWLPYMGWGIRVSRRYPLRSSAYSVPFLRAGVGVETTGGMRYQLSSWHPEQLAQATTVLMRSDEAVL